MGGMYKLTMFMFCRDNRIWIDCSSRVLSAGRCARVCVVVLVKGMSECISVIISPPPSPVCLSCLSVVYPGNFGVLSFCFSFVS